MMRFSSWGQIFSLIAASLVASDAQADVVGGKVGVQYWQTASTGEVGEATDATIPWNTDPEGQYRVYLSIEHPLFLLPNLKVGYSSYDVEQATTLDKTYRLAGQLYSIGSSLDLIGENQLTDVITYYEILDRDILSFDLGVNFRSQSSTYGVSDLMANTESSASISEIAPMFYAKLSSGLPLIGISSYIEYQAGDNNHDYEVALGYRFVDNLAVNLTVLIGYKEQRLSYQFNDGIYANSEWRSAFVGLEAHF